MRDLPAATQEQAEVVLTETILTDQIMTAKARKSLTEETNTTVQGRKEEAENAVLSTLTEEITIEEATAGTMSAVLTETEEKAESAARLATTDAPSTETVLSATTEKVVRDVRSTLTGLTEERAARDVLSEATVPVAKTTEEDRSAMTDVRPASAAPTERTVRSGEMTAVVAREEKVVKDVPLTPTGHAGKTASVDPTAMTDARETKGALSRLTAQVARKADAAALTVTRNLTERTEQKDWASRRLRKSASATVAGKRMTYRRRQPIT